MSWWRRTKQTQGGKPIAPSGMVCPLHRRDVSEVCHTCAFYGSLPVGFPAPAVEGQPPKVAMEWACALVHAVRVSCNVLRGTETTTASTDKVANAVSGLSADIERHNAVVRHILNSAVRSDSAPGINHTIPTMITHGDRDARHDRKA